MSDSMTIWRTRARWFAAEFLVIVTGVLVALALNSIYQRSQDRRHESTYLALLNRDMRQTVTQLEDKMSFEAAQTRDGLAAYRALSAGPVPLEERNVVSGSLGKLTDRRTMVLRDATYQDLISTGNLRLIRNRDLRDRIVDFYETTRGDYEIMNRNNAYLVDQLYLPMAIGRGLIKPGRVAGNTRVLADVQSKLLADLQGGYITEPDYIWSLPPNSREWAELKSGLVTRIRVAAISERYAREVLERTRRLSAALDAEQKEK